GHLLSGYYHCGLRNPWDVLRRIPSSNLPSVHPSSYPDTVIAVNQPLFRHHHQHIDDAANPQRPPARCPRAQPPRFRHALPPLPQILPLLLLPPLLLHLHRRLRLRLLPDAHPRPLLHRRLHPHRLLLGHPHRPHPLRLPRVPLRPQARPRRPRRARRPLAVRLRPPDAALHPRRRPARLRRRHQPPLRPSPRAHAARGRCGVQGPRRVDKQGTETRRNARFWYT
ncbi:hypothetical protein C8R46DRAFT_1303390, partial [Mycena filopes]